MRMQTFFGVALIGTVCCTSNVFAEEIVPLEEGAGAQIEYKKGASVSNLHQSMKAAYGPIIESWKICAPGKTPVITSGFDSFSEHRVNSWHRKYRAIDVRGRNVRGEQLCIREELAKRLASNQNHRYIILWEEFPHQPERNHFHIQAPE